MKNKKRLLYIILPLVIICSFLIVVPTTTYINRKIRANSENSSDLSQTPTTSSNIQSSILLTEPTIIEKYGLFSDEGEVLYSWNDLIDLNYISVSDDGALSTKDILSEDDSLSNINLEGNLIISDEVLTISDNAFYNWAGVKSLYITDKVTSIGENAFAYCTNLSCVYFTGNIDNWYFMQCPVFRYSLNENHLYLYNDENDSYEEIINVTIPNTMSNITKFQFCGYNNILSFNASNNINTIEFEALLRCNKLEYIQLPFVGYDLNGYDNRHFGYIFGAKTPDENKDYVPETLKTIIINNQTIIGDKAFLDLENILYVTLNSVINIKEDVFKGCTSLEYIILDSTLKHIGNNAFEGTDISSVFFKGSEYEWTRQIVYSNDYSHPDYSFDENDKLTLRSDDVYLYSKTRPESPYIPNDYWYYNDDNIPTVWE